WNDRNTENKVEPGRKDREPDKRPDQGRKETPALVQKAQPFASRDTDKAAQVINGLHAASRSCTRVSNAARIEGIRVCPSSWAASPAALTSPLCNTTTRAPSPTSSIRWVAQS